MDKYATIAVCFLLVLSGVTEMIAMARATQYVNVVLDMETTTSSFSPDYEGLYAVDGDIDTRWLNDAGGGTDWIYADCLVDQLVFNATVTIFDDGNYNFEVQRSFDAVTWINITSGTHTSGIETLTFAFSPVDGRYFRFLAWGAQAWVGVLEFCVYGSAVESPSASELQLNWMGFIVLLAFAFLNVVLMLVPRFYVLNFVVGALTLAFSAATVNDSTLPIQPYFSLIVALLSVLGILRAANLLRNG